MFCLGSY